MNVVSCGLPAAFRAYRHEIKAKTKTAERGKLIAIYHLSIKIISRGKGKSAVAAAAYRSGEKITNEYDGITHDYTKKGGIAHTEILLPQNAPPEYVNRSVLWNAVEKIEKARNSQLAREIEIALPNELSGEEQKKLVHEYCKKHFVSAGMCVDICIHDKKDGNPHAHIMLTVRPFNEDRTWGDKQKKEYILDPQGNKIYDPQKRSYKCKSIATTDWNEQTKAEEWRAAWASIANEYLQKNNSQNHIDHRSYERQGIEQMPTVHLGVAAFQMEKRGIKTERGDINRAIEVTNQQLRQLKARIGKLKNWLADETENNKPPTLADVIQRILSNGDNQSQNKKVFDLKTAAKIFLFLQENNISSLSELQGKIKEFYTRQLGLRDKLKPIERRLKVLDEHITQSENYNKYKDLYNRYKEQKPNKKQAFYEKNRAEITLFQAAKRYLTDHLNGHKTIPLYTWKEERKNLLIEQNVLSEQYYRLKEEVREVEIIKRNVEQIIGQEKQHQTKKYDMEL